MTTAQQILQHAMEGRMKEAYELFLTDPTALKLEFFDFKTSIEKAIKRHKENERAEKAHWSLNQN